MRRFLLVFAALLAVTAVAVRSTERVPPTATPSATELPRDDAGPPPVAAAPPAASSATSTSSSPASPLRLEPAQRAAVDSIRADYSARLIELHRTTDWTRAESRLRFDSVQRVILADFDRAVSAALPPAQAERWRALPEWRRSPDADLDVEGD